MLNVYTDVMRTFNALSAYCLLGKPEGRWPLGRPRRRWVDNIRTDLQEVGWGYMDWIGLAQDRHRWRTLVSAVMNLWVPWNFLTSCKPVSCSRRTPHHGVSKYGLYKVTEKQLQDHPIIFSIVRVVLSILETKSPMHVKLYYLWLNPWIGGLIAPQLN